MHPVVFRRLVVRPVLDWLGKPFDSLEAETLLIAIAYQESTISDRDQGDDQTMGPARGFYQFEQIAVRDFIMRGHPTIKAKVQELNMPLSTLVLWQAIGYGADHLATLLARDRLYRLLRQPLPALGDNDEAYRQYDAAWRPGIKRPEDWETSYAMALPESV